jgi:hypothetical protein
MDVRKVALLSTGRVGTDDDSERGVPGRRLQEAADGATKVTIRSALVSSCGAAVLAALPVGS